MNKSLLAVNLALAASLPVHAGVLYELAFGAMRDSEGTALPDSTLVVLIANTSPAEGLPGGLTGADLTASGLDPAAAFDQFAGQSLTVGGTINGDTIIYVGAINSEPNWFPPGMLYEPNLTYNDYPTGVAAGQAFGIYWFPGISNYAGAPLPTNPFEMGGFHNPALNTNQSDSGMTLQVLDPAGVYKIYQLASDTAASFELVSATAPAAFSAVLVPEPSAVLLAALGGLLALRRRRA